ncbi:Uncharacterised protein [Enterobacter hormaechei]|jgi:hypothetical protein|nr:Uncharacterised protein [Enterobacter hormaechei]
MVGPTTCRAWASNDMRNATMSKLLVAPAEAANSTISLSPIDLAKEDPELSEYFRLYAEAEAADTARAAGSWYRAGSGPAPTQGGVWIGGTILTPISTPPANSIISSIGYSWDNTNLRGWASQVSVRVVIVASTGAWEADVTAANTGTIGVGALSIPANAQIQFQIKVGTLQVSLYQPPFIQTNSVTVNYTY